MIDTEQLEKDLKEDEEEIELLFQRFTEQQEDIKELKEVLNEMSEDQGVRRNGAAADS